MTIKKSSLLIFWLLVGVMAACSAVHAAVSVPEKRYYEYLAQPGDTLIGIAQQHIVDSREVKQLQKINKLNGTGAVKEGSFVRIPVSAMRQELSPAEIVAVSGPAFSNNQKIGAGGSIAEGTYVATGAGGFATIRLPNRSLLIMQPNTRLQLAILRQLGNTGGIPDYLVELAAGRIEIIATNQPVSTALFRIRTPEAQVNVSDGSLRVAYDETTKRTLAEVIEGTDTLHRRHKPKAALLNSGFGSPASHEIEPTAAALLPPPDLIGAKKIFTSSAAHFEFAALPGALSYRALMAKDASFTDVIADVISQSASVDFSSVPQGQLFLRLRGIDGNGLQGKDAFLAFQTKLPPAVPQLSIPGVAAQMSPGTTSFAWGAAPGASGYRLQLSRTAQFNELLVDQEVVGSLQFFSEKPLTAGSYFWRVAAARDGEFGEFSEIGQFSVRQLPAQLKIPEVSGGEVRFAWAGGPDENYQFQLSRNERFTDIVVERTLDKPEVLITELSKNIYYTRVRLADRSSGKTAAEWGPWSEIQQVEVYGSNWWLLLFGLPIL